MRIKYILFTTAFILSCFFAKSQSNENWQFILLGADGTNSFNGVEGYYRVTTCGNKEVVQIKLINHNNYRVRAGWKGMVQTNYDQQLFGNNQADSVTIAANSTVIGDCSGNSALTRSLGDFNTDASNLKTYNTTGFDFIILH